MELLLIGFSRFARRRVLPAVASLPGITAVDVASRHATPGDLAGVVKARDLYGDWRAAVEVCAPGLAYVSLENGEHGVVVRELVERGWHVVVDKPACVDAGTVESARRSGVVLAEATCYSFHPVFRVVEGFAADTRQVVAVFTPPVPVDDFRHDPVRGGGALLDTGPYLASLGRVLWGLEPEEVSVVVGEREGGLVLSYSVLARYAQGRSVVGHFGFTGVYQNTLQLLGGRQVVDVRRPFSMPPGLETEVRVRDGGGERVVRVPPADSMAVFLGRVLDAVSTGSREFDGPLLGDARTLGRLVRAAGAGGERWGGGVESGFP
ncbi:Gfo/Idh/MocA family oxidoreductase [Streptomyces sp. NPDC004539]|uniref:Gfo/Idh/MocA family protein n=1 Tax=Streptomyces sp. NPDC004539 TaxID=3154280 RepID=UPI0033B47CD1